MNYNDFKKFGFKNDELFFQKVFNKNPSPFGSLSPSTVKIEQIQLLIKEILFNSTAQAILKIYQTKSWVIKIFWLVCLACACSLCSYFVIESVITFVSYEVNTKTRSFTEQTSLFPKITFCNKNLFTTKYAADLANDSSYEDLVYMVNFKLNETEKLKLAKNFEDILLDCSFNSVKCSASDFAHEYDPNLGNCYSFNSGFNSTGHRVSLKDSIRAGSSYGMKLVVYVNFNQRLKKFNKYLGALVKIGNSSYANSNYGVEVFINCSL